MKFSLRLLILITIASCMANSDFNEGQCIQAKDNYIYKISRIEGSNYTVQGGVPKWENETSLSRSV